VLVVYAKTEPEKGPHGITAFLIERVRHLAANVSEVRVTCHLTVRFYRIIGHEGIQVCSEVGQARHARLQHLRARF
jgi:alkylation response protein AidB-like acyl-CoA dehydrogenase